MNEIIFVVNSNRVHLYFWNCIKDLTQECVSFKATILINERAKNKNKFVFNSIINYVDSKFSNHKTNPLSLLNIEEQNLGNKITITRNHEDLKLSDWIIFENKPSESKNLINRSKNGFLLLEVNQNTVIWDVLNQSSITLNILHNNLASKNWNLVSEIKLKKEVGIKNNIYKILHNYFIYLSKFIKNTDISKLGTKSKHDSLITRKKKDNLLKVITIIYYLKLIFILLIRKINKKKLNWKIAIKIDHKLFFLKQPKKTFWADPFIIKPNDKNLFVYFEELKQNNLGKISCIQLNQNFEIIKKEDIINTEYHLSFPNVFFKDDAYYMIPESSQNNTLQLYKCKHFPFKWDFQMNLMENIRLLDAVWIHHNNLYWIFANKIEDFEHENNERLYVYYSDDLFTNNWKPHIKNPVISNAGFARNAGKFIYNNGKIIRVSQNCRDGYGQNLVFNEIKLLTVHDYMEIKVNEIFPKKGYVGTHTFNEHENVGVLDFLI